MSSLLVGRRFVEFVSLLHLDLGVLSEQAGAYDPCYSGGFFFASHTGGQYVEVHQRER